MRIIAYINLTLIALIGLTGAFIYAVHAQATAIQEEPKPILREIELPKSPFPQLDVSLDQGPLGLTWVSPKATLPDLRHEIVYLGKNHRPDVEEGKSRFYIAAGRQKDPISVLSFEKLYLQYSAGSYSKSPGNAPTPLWLEMNPISGDASGAEYLEVKAHLFDEQHSLITVPQAHHVFTVKMEDKKPAANPWDIGGARVDASLLIRQGARLTGKDLFLDMHGGDLFKDVLHRDRLDFLSGDHPYCCFVKEGDFLIWKDKKWQRVTSQGQSCQYPLFVIKKLDEKSLSAELWDVEGKNKCLLTLPRSKNYEPPIDMNQEFKLVGAKTWVECVLECRGKRFVVKEGDWLVLTTDGWHKINSEQEVDDYVEQKITGPMFILDKISKKNNRTTLIGHLFSTMRTTVVDVELTNQDNLLKAELES